MKTINETYEIALKDKKIEVIHKGYKSLNNNSLRDLKEVIIESIDRDKNIDGFIPYNNFECSITWRVI